MTDYTPYQALAKRLNELPQGFPATDDGSELRLLAYLFTPEEAALGAQLRLTLEKPAEIAERLGMEMREVAGLLKSMAKKGLIKVGGIPRGGLGFGALPFVWVFMKCKLAVLIRNLHNYLKIIIKKREPLWWK